MGWTLPSPGSLCFTREKGVLLPTISSSPRPRLLALAAAMGVVVALLVPQLASAATFGGGKVTLSFGKSFASALKSSHTKVQGLSGAKAKGRKVSFTIKSGSGTLAPPYKAKLSLNGTLGFKRGKSSARFKKLTEAVGKSAFKSGKSTVFSESTKGKVAPQSGFTGLNVKGASLKLSKGAAKTLNRRLKTKKFKAGMKAGTVTASANRSVTFTGGNTRVQLDPGTSAKMSSCGITLTGIAPATVTPDKKINLPINGGKLDAKTLLGSVTHAGGIHLEKGGPDAHSSDLTQFEIQFVLGGGGFSALASDIGNARVPVGPVDRTGQVAQGQFTATGGNVSFHGGSLRLSATAAGLLNGNFHCGSTFVAGDPLGTIEELSGPVK